MISCQLIFVQMPYPAAQDLVIRPRFDTPFHMGRKLKPWNASGISMERGIDEDRDWRIGGAAIVRSHDIWRCNESKSNQENERTDKAFPDLHSAKSKKNQKVQPTSALSLCAYIHTVNEKQTLKLFSTFNQSICLHCEPEKDLRNHASLPLEV